MREGTNFCVEEMKGLGKLPELKDLGVNSFRPGYLDSRGLTGALNGKGVFVERFDDEGKRHGVLRWTDAVGVDADSNRWALIYTEGKYVQGKRQNIHHVNLQSFGEASTLEGKADRRVGCYQERAPDGTVVGYVFSTMMGKGGNLVHRWVRVSNPNGLPE